MNTKKLLEAYKYLGWVHDSAKCKEQVNEQTVEYIMDLIHEFMIDNEPKKKNAFNIWDWTANDPLRPVMNGVFHDIESKMAVASNAHILVADSECYDESKVSGEFQSFGRCMPVDKYGKHIEGRFPNWKAVIPQQTDEWTLHHIDLNELSEYIKKCNTYMKLNGMTGKYSKQVVYKVGTTWFLADYLRMFAIATDGDIYVKSHDKPAVYWGDKRKVLLMPMYLPEEDIAKGKLIPEAMANGMYIID